MIVTFYNKKGGTGKTSLAYSIAIDLDFYLLSNDDSFIEDYTDRSKIMPEIELIKGEDIIYDLGGFVNTDVVEIIENSDILVIPTTLDKDSVGDTINTLKEVSDFDSVPKLIILVINRYEKTDDERHKMPIQAMYDTLKKVSLKRNIHVKSVIIPESKILRNDISYTGKSIKQMCNENAFSRYRCRNIYPKYEKLLDAIKKFKESK